MSKFFNISKAAKHTIILCVIAVLSFSGLGEKLSSSFVGLNDKDLMIRWTSLVAGGTRNAIPVTVVMVDDATIQALGATGETPRGFVADFIRLAARKGAGNILVDIDFTKAGSQPEGDEALGTFLKDYAADAPPLLLPKKFVTGKPQDNKPGKLEPTTSFLDPLITGKPNIFWTASLAQVDEDRTIRRWQLSQSICQDQTGTTYPSPQLIGAASMGTPKRSLTDISTYLDFRTEKTCAKSKADGPAWPRNADDNANITFLFGTNPSANALHAIIQQGRVTPLYRQISARSLIGNDKNLLKPEAIAADLFQGRFVILGTDHGESHDTHMTPLGMLPGALIVANAVATAPAILDSAELTETSRNATALGIFVVLALIAAFARALVVAVIGGIICLVLLMVLGRIYAPATAIDIIITALGMGAIFTVLESLYDIVVLWRSGLKWRALLKPAKPNPTQGQSE